MSLKGKTVLITGGTGSFGNAFVRKLLKDIQPKKIIIFSRDEMKQYEMAKAVNHPSVRYFVGDVRDRDRLMLAFKNVDIVVHAAALKIVPTAEYNPFEAIQTNIIGSENVIQAAIENKVQKLLALSTDKASNPINLYGATKLCLEKMVVAANNYSPEGTQMSVVRYGNVIGSRGSVIPFFKQCRDRDFVPITDPRMTRFWITLDQGVQFVLDSIDGMKGGEIFIPKIPSVRIVDLANLICPGVPHKTIGIRPGEKIHETLVSSDDGLCTYECPTQYVMRPQVVESKKGQVQTDACVGADFDGYRSDNNTEWLDEQSLRSLLEQEELKAAA